MTDIPRGLHQSSVKALDHKMDAISQVAGRTQENAHKCSTQALTLAQQEDGILKELRGQLSAEAEKLFASQTIISP